MEVTIEIFIWFNVWQSTVENWSSECYLRARVEVGILVRHLAE